MRRHVGPTCLKIPGRTLCMSNCFFYIFVNVISLLFVAFVRPSYVFHLLYNCCLCFDYFYIEFLSHKLSVPVSGVQQLLI